MSLIGILDDMVDRMHNPWIMYSRLVMFALMCLCVWMHEAYWALILLASTIFSPFFFTKPEELDESSGYYKMIEGTRKWIKSINKILLLILYIIGLALLAFIIWALWNHLVLYSLISISGLILFKTTALFYIVKNYT